MRRGLEVTKCQATGARVPPGADHRQHYMDYVMQAGVALRRLPGGDWERVAIRDPARARFKWEVATAFGGPVALFEGPDGREYAQPLPPHNENVFLTPRRRRR